MKLGMRLVAPHYTRPGQHEMDLRLLTLASGSKLVADNSFAS